MFFGIGIVKKEEEKNKSDLRQETTPIVHLKEPANRDTSLPVSKNKIK